MKANEGGQVVTSVTIAIIDSLDSGSITSDWCGDDNGVGSKDRVFKDR
jgi:hypothetical protein